MPERIDPADDQHNRWNWGPGRECHQGAVHAWQGGRTLRIELIAALTCAAGLGCVADVIRLEPGEALKCSPEPCACTDGSVGVIACEGPPICGCDDGPAVVDEPVVDDDDPHLVVTPRGLDFGTTVVGAPVLRELTLENSGGGRVALTALAIDAPYAIVGATPRSLGPQEQVELQVRFDAPAVGRYISGLQIKSTDPTNPELAVRLVGLVEQLAPCRFTIDRPTVDFGTTAVGQDVVERVTVTNAGRDACVLLGGTFATGAPFSVAGAVQRIEARSDATIDVTFAPREAGTFDDRLTVGISNPATPSFDIAVRGEAIATPLRFIPDPLDFGAVNPACGATTRELTVHHDRGPNRELLAVHLDSPDGAFLLLPRTPGTPFLPPSGSVVATVQLTPQSAMSQHRATLQLTESSRAPARRHVVEVLGEGTSATRGEDRFVQLTHPQADILFVVDDSCSMAQEQMSLSANFASFARFATELDVDYHIGVTTTDFNEGRTPARGRLVPLSGASTSRIVTPRSRPSPAAAFEANANVGLDAATFTEQGLHAAYRALSAPNRTGHNAGFLRQDAYLAVIFVSDEDDQSPRELDFYVDFFRGLKGTANPELFSASAIVGELPDGCQSPNGQADAPLRYADVVTRTGGVLESICTSDWAGTLERLSYAAFGLRKRFTLDAPAVASSIEVRVDGVAIAANAPDGSTNWSFTDGAVAFDRAPDANAAIVIRYDRACR